MTTRKFAVVNGTESMTRKAEYPGTWGQLLDYATSKAWLQYMLDLGCPAKQMAAKAKTAIHSKYRKTALDDKGCIDKILLCAETVTEDNGKYKRFVLFPFVDTDGQPCVYKVQYLSTLSEDEGNKQRPKKRKGN